MRYLLKDWGIGGKTTSPLEVQTPALLPPPPKPIIPPPGEECVDIGERFRKRAGLLEDTLLEALTSDDCPWSTKIAAVGLMTDRGWGRVQPYTAPPSGNVTINISGDKMSVKEKLEYGAEVLAVLRETEEQAQQVVEVEFKKEPEDEAVNQ